MKVTLNITEDAELRSVLKEAIMEQVRGIVREELRNMVVDELRRKVRESAALSDADTVKRTVYRECAAMVRELLPPGSITKAELLPLVDAAVDRIFRGADFARLVEQTANAKITALVSAK